MRATDYVFAHECGAFNIPSSSVAHVLLSILCVTCKGRSPNNFRSFLKLYISSPKLTMTKAESFEQGYLLWERKDMTMLRLISKSEREHQLQSKSIRGGWRKAKRQNGKPENWSKAGKRKSFWKSECEHWQRREGTAERHVGNGWNRRTELTSRIIWAP